MQVPNAVHSPVSLAVVDKPQIPLMTDGVLPAESAVRTLFSVLAVTKPLAVTLGLNVE